jgi:hypothetical protein
MAYQDDKYENFMAKLGASRPALANFADFSVAAIGAPGVDGLIADCLPELTKARDAFRQEMVERAEAGGTSKAGTATEAEAFAAFQAFIRATEIDVLRPYLRRHPAEEALFYPDLLSGLTSAPKKLRPTRLTTYTQALEAADAKLPALPVPDGAPAGTVGERPGAAARALLKTYEAVFTNKVGSRTQVKDSIADFSPALKALTDSLWRLHCTALFVHHTEPKQARKYFNYAGLPHRVIRGSKSGRKKTDSPSS